MDTSTPSYYDDPRLQEARTSYEAAQRQATDTAASAASLPAMLKDALTKKFSMDNPLVQNREQALQNYLTVTSRAPLDVTPRSAGGNADVIYTPEQQASLMGAKRATAIAPLSTANYLLGLATGGISDIVNSASQAANAEATRQQGNATLSRQSYQDLLNELSLRADEALKNKELSLKSNTSGGFDITSLLAALAGGNVLGTDTGGLDLSQFEEPDQTESKPPPKKKEVKVNLKSTVKAGQIPGAQGLPTNSNDSGFSLLSLLSNLFKGPEPLNVKSSSELGL